MAEDNKIFDQYLHTNLKVGIPDPLGKVLRKTGETRPAEPGEYFTVGSNGTVWLATERTAAFDILSIAPPITSEQSRAIDLIKDFIKKNGSLFPERIDVEHRNGNVDLIYSNGKRRIGINKKGNLV